MAALSAACSSWLLVSGHSSQAVSSPLTPFPHLSLSHAPPVLNGHKFQTFGPPLALRHLSRSVASQFEEIELTEEEDDDENEEEEEEDGFEGLSKEDFEKAAKLAATEYRQSLLEEILLEDEAAETGGRKRKKKPSRLYFEDENRVPDNLLPKVVVVGRPNVGKSALFNRIAGGDIAIVHDEPGVTRDRLYGRAYWGTQEFMLVDTGGVMTIPNRDGMDSDGIAVTTSGGPEALDRAMRDAAAAGLPALIEKQAAAAVEESSSIIFVVDGQAGVTAADIDIANWLRKKHSNKTIILAVNKCESPTKGFLQTAEFWSLGFTPLAISAISGTGTGDLLDAVCVDLKTPQLPDEQQDTVDRPLAIAIVGKPNVGKSSILNALVGEERTIVSPISGTTRDAIDTDFVTPDGQTVKLIDTAGIRRRSAVASAGSVTEGLSVNRAFRAIRRSDVVTLVIDALACVTEQDYKLGERIEKEGKACVIVVNKWDTILEKDNKTTQLYERDVRDRLRVLDWAPIVYSSATTGQRISKILVAAIAAGKERARRLSTATLNQVIQETLLLRQPPTTRGGKKGKLYYCTQAGVRPPTFVLFVNDAKLFPDMYRRYVEKQIRKNVGYPGTPIRLLWRGKDKPSRDKRKG